MIPAFPNPPRSRSWGRRRRGLGRGSPPQQRSYYFRFIADHSIWSMAIIVASILKGSGQPRGDSIDMSDDRYQRKWRYRVLWRRARRLPGASISAGLPISGYTRSSSSGISARNACSQGCGSNAGTQKRSAIAQSRAVRGIFVVEQADQPGPFDP